MKKEKLGGTGGKWHKDGKRKFRYERYTFDVDLLNDGSCSDEQFAALVQKVSKTMYRAGARALKQAEAVNVGAICGYGTKLTSTY